MSASVNLDPKFFMEYMHIYHDTKPSGDIYIIIKCEYCDATFDEFPSGLVRSNDYLTAAVHHYQDKHPKYLRKYLL